MGTGRDDRGASRWSAVWRSMPPTVWILSGIAFCVSMGYGVVIPVLPLIAVSFGVGLFEVGVVIAAFSLSRILISPFVPRLIDKFGDRVMVSVGQFISAASYGLMGLAQSYEQLVLLRFLAGLGSVMFTISAMNLLIMLVPADRRGRAVGIWQGGFQVGNMAGPALGGLLAMISLAAPFFFYAATLTAAGLVGVIFLRPPPQARPDTGSGQGPTAGPRLTTVLADARFQAALLSTFAWGWSSIGARTALVPVLVTAILHRDPVWVGVAFTVGALVQMAALLPVSRFVDTVGRRPGIILSAVLSATGIMLVAVAPALWVLIVALSILGVGSAFAGTAPAAAVADAAGSRASRPIAVFTIMQDVGMILGPIVAGILWDHTNPVVAFGVGALLLLASGAAGLRMPRQHPLPDD